MKNLFLFSTFILLPLIGFSQAPANDECASPDPIALSTTASSYTSDLLNATESTQTGTCDAATNLDVWYEFTMPATGNVRITGLFVYDKMTLYSTCVDTSEIACFTDDGFFYDLQGGTTYLLRHAIRSQNAAMISFTIQAFDKAVNDECVDRTAITVEAANVNSYTSQLANATDSVQDGTCDSNNVNLDVWYEFTMPVTGNLRITNMFVYDKLTIYADCNDTSEIACFTDDNFFYSLTGGTTYILRHAIRSQNAADRTFNIQVFPTAANDECVDRTTIAVETANSNQYTSQLANATDSVQDGTCDSNSVNLDVWYEFTMPVTGNVRITDMFVYDKLTIYADCNDTSEIACFTDDNFFYQLTGGTTYILRHAIRSQNGADRTFTIQAFAAVGNDECVDRTSITVETANQNSYISQFEGATEGVQTGTCDTNNTNLDVWYEFVMPVNGNVRITDLFVYDVMTIYSSCVDTSEVGCFIDDGFFFDLQAGNTYFLRHSKRSQNAGDTSFDIQAFTASINDDCLGAEALNVGVVTPTDHTFDNRGGTEGLDATCDNAGNINMDLWYTFTMPVTGNIAITNSNNNTGVSFFDSCGGAELDCFSGNGTYFGVAAGTDVLMRISRTQQNANPNSFSIQAIASPLSPCSATTEFIGGTWNNGPPNITTSAIVRSIYDTATHGSFTSCSLAIDSGTTLTIASGDYIDVAFNIDVSGTLNVHHEANLIQRDDVSTTTKTGSINVEVTTPFLKPRDFMVLGSPLDGETRRDVFGSAFKVLNHTTANFVPHPDVALQFPMAENFADDNGDNWTNHTGAIIPGEGYLVWPQANIGDGNTTYTLDHTEGIFNNGNIAFNVVFNNDKNDSPNNLANPYASAISADDFINTNTMIDEVFFWEHITTPGTGVNFPGYLNANYSMQDISMYNLLGGVAAANDLTGTDTAPNGFISTGQGFGIKATAAGTAMFTNGMRRLSNNNTLRTSEEKDRIWLTVRSNEYELQNATLIGFSSETSEAIDKGYDSRRLATVVSLYSHLEDGTNELGIQAREVFDPAIKIPMGFSTLVDEQTTYTISIANLEGANLVSSQVFLYDNLLEILTNLSESDYEFVADFGTYGNRFSLQFGEQILDASDEQMNSLLIFPNPVSSQLIIANPNGLALDSAEIYDITGRLMSSYDLHDSGSQKSIDVSNLTSGNYFVMLYSGQEILTKKMIKD